jgi:two-component system, NarL family, nitrate/nitrite response regulator NarL
MAGAELAAQPRTALIIDDSMLVQARLKQLVRRLDFELVGIAATGAEGVAQAMTLRPGLILLDHQLPDAYGQDVARELRGAGVEAHIIAITGTLAPETEAEFRAAGVGQILTKPVDPERLAQAVAACGFTVAAALLGA